MPDVRSRPPRRLLGPLCASLAVHALVVGAAASVGITLIAEERAEASPLALALKERVELPPEPALPGPESRDELPASFASALPEPELADPDFLAVLPPPPEAAEASREVPQQDGEDVVTEVVEAEVAPTPDRPRSPAFRPVALAPTVASNRARLGVGGSGASAGSAGFPGSSAGRPVASAVLGGVKTTGMPSWVGIGRGSGASHLPVLVQKAKPLDTPRPMYPALSLRAGEQGSVLCRLHLSDAGDVTLVEVIESSGFPRLDAAAQKTLLGWRFEPRRLDGRAVASTLTHRVTFRLESAASPTRIGALRPSPPAAAAR